MGHGHVRTAEAPTPWAKIARALADSNTLKETETDFLGKYNLKKNKHQEGLEN